MMLQYYKVRNKYENIFYWTISEKYSLSARQPSGAITDVKKMKVSLTNFEKKMTYEIWIYSVRCLNSMFIAHVLCIERNATTLPQLYHFLLMFFMDRQTQNLCWAWFFTWHLFRVTKSEWFLFSSNACLH